MVKAFNEMPTADWSASSNLREAASAVRLTEATGGDGPLPSLESFIADVGSGYASNWTSLLVAMASKGHDTEAYGAARAQSRRLRSSPSIKSPQASLGRWRSSERAHLSAPRWLKCLDGALTGRIRSVTHRGLRGRHRMGGCGTCPRRSPRPERRARRASPVRSCARDRRAGAVRIGSQEVAAQRVP